VSRIFDALTVAQDEVVERLASLSEPSAEEEEPENGSSASWRQSELPQELDGFIAEHQQPPLPCPIDGMHTAEEAHRPSDGGEGFGDQKFELLVPAGDAPRPTVSEAPEPSGAFRSTPRTGMRQAALIAATGLIALSAVAAVHAWRARSSLLRLRLTPKAAVTIPDTPVPPEAVPPAKPVPDNNTLKPAVPAQKLVVVEPDQTLAGISTRHLGQYNAAVLAKLRELNPSLRDPDHIEAGQQIRLPVAAVGESGNDRNRRRATGEAGNLR